MRTNKISAIVNAHKTVMQEDKTDKTRKMKRKKRIMLHIGMPKAGSSAVQYFLTRNRATLEKNGIGYYMPKHRYNPWNGNSNADFLTHKVMNDIGVFTNQKHAAWLEEECRAFSEYCKSCDKIILSEEKIWDIGRDYKDFLPALKEEVASFCGEDAIIDIICYLRRQDEWMLSHWKENIRSDRNVNISFAEAARQYQEQESLDYLEAVDRISEAFGSESIKLRSYDNCTRLRGGVVGDFADIAGLRSLDGLQIIKSKVNKAFSINATEALRLIKQGSIPCECSWEAITYALHKLHKAARVEENSFPMSYSERMSLLEKYAEGNRRLSEKYLGGEELFSSELSEYDEWKADAKRDMGNAMAIAKLAEKLDLTSTA